MKVLETLGQHRGAQKGIFQYKRTVDGVLIDSSVGQANLDPPEITVTTREWTAILSAIRDNEHRTFRLTTTDQQPEEPPYTSLYQLLVQAVPDPERGWNWHDSCKSYICAILEHEGSIDLYHGTLGRNATAIICLACAI
jgi:hypothetical protein